MQFMVEPIATGLRQGAIAEIGEAWRVKLQEDAFPDPSRVGEKLSRVERYGQAGPRNSPLQLMSWRDGESSFFSHDADRAQLPHARHTGLASSDAHALLHRPLATRDDDEEAVMAVPRSMHHAISTLVEGCWAISPEVEPYATTADPAVEGLWFALALFMPEARVETMAGKCIDARRGWQP